MGIQAFYNISSLINLVISIAFVLGAQWVYNRSAVKEALEIHAKTATMQESAITAMEQQIASLESKILSLEKENNRQEQVILTICESLKSRGFDITVSGNMVNIRDGNQTSSVRINDK